MRLELNPAHIVTFNDFELIVETEESLSKISFSKLSLSSTRLAAILSEQRLDWSSLTDAERESIGILLQSGSVIFRDCLAATEIETPQDPSFGYFAGLTPFPDLSLKKLRVAHVCILGLGGTGSSVLQQLVGMGIKMFTLVDCDVLKFENLNRQFIGGISDVDRRKIDVGRDYIRARALNSVVYSHQLRIETADEIVEFVSIGTLRPSLIINCIDFPYKKIENIVYTAGGSLGIAVVTGSVGQSFGSWGPLISSATPCWQCWDASLSERRLLQTLRSTRTKPTPWSFGPTNSIVASQIAMLASSFLSGISAPPSDATRTVLDFGSGATYKHAYTRPCKHRSNTILDATL